MINLGRPEELSGTTPFPAVRSLISSNGNAFRCTILIVDDEPGILALLADQLKAEFHVITASSAAEARSAFAQSDVDILISDLKLPDSTGVHLLEWVRQVAPRTARVLLTGAARLEDAVGAINHSRVHRLILKPWRVEDLIAGLRDTARAVLLERNHEQLLEEYRRLNGELEQRVQERTKAHEQSLSELKLKNQILEKMALTDALTGLPNRRAIDLIARKELLRRTRSPSPITIGLMDADRFKDINSTYHLSGGDHVLIWLGQTLQSGVRASDALGRVGGEEFMVVAPNTDLPGADRLAERLRSTVAERDTNFNSHTIRVTVSGGFAVADMNDHIGYERIREVAAEALAEAKATGRNRCIVRRV